MGFITSVGRWSMRHPWRAIGLWLAFVVLAVVAMAATGTQSLQNGAVGESARGYDLIDRHRAWGPAREYGYVHSDKLVANAPAFRAATADVAARMRKLLGDNVDVRISNDRHAALIVGMISSPISIEGLRAAVLAAGALHPQVAIEESGDITASSARDKVVNRDLHRAELLSIPVTLFVLLFAFGAIVAALVPLLLALTAVAAAFGLLGPISQAFPLDDSVKTVLVLIGMAVGVDYALFYVMRSREERRHGLSADPALERTVRTSGRTVVVSGTTVAIAMAGMYFVGLEVFNGIASGTIAVVLCAVIGSVTVLPAVLELLGARIDRGRIPFLPHLHTDSSHARFWPAVIERVLRRPVVSLLLSAGLLLALALPALGLHLATPSNESLSSQKEPALATLGHIRAGFPGTSAPAQLVVVWPAGQQAAAERALTQLERSALARRIVHPPFTLNTGGDGISASVDLPLSGSGANGESRRAIQTLRHEFIPATLGRVPGVETALTGVTAEDIDFTHQCSTCSPSARRTACSSSCSSTVGRSRSSASRPTARSSPGCRCSCS